VVAYLVLRGDLGGEVGFAYHVVADLEEGGPDALAVEDLQKLSRVGMAGAVVEGQGDYLLGGAGMPEDATVERATGGP
jgi:hypothetical protein